MDFDNLAEEIWSWAEDGNIFLFASFIASKDNVTADYLSRIRNNNIAWKLADFAFQIITNTFGTPGIDLFASYWNRKYDNFVSWFPQTGACKIHAFTFNWSSLTSSQHIH